MSTASIHSERSGNHSLDEASFDILNSPSSQNCLLCPLNEAPRCFKTALTRALELGEGNFIPTNWRGFSDYFRLQELKGRSAEELVDVWADEHPFKHEHTLLKVVEYAQNTGHVKLLQLFKETFKGNFILQKSVIMGVETYVRGTVGLLVRAWFRLSHLLLPMRLLQVLVRSPVTVTLLMCMNYSL